MLAELAAAVVLAILSATAPAPEAHTMTGWLSAYDQEPSEGTIAYRCNTGDLPCDDVEAWPDVLIAVADCSLIGKRGTMTYEDSGLELSVIVFDCSGHDVEPGTAVLTAAGFVGELDYASWQTWGLGRVEVVIDD